MKRTQDGGREINISVISLDSTEVTGYYTPLFQPELKKRFLYENLAWRYTGQVSSSSNTEPELTGDSTNEFLIYYACKPMVTIPLSRIVEWTSKHVNMGEALRLAELGEGGTYYHHILANFKRQKRELTSALARAIGKIGTSLFGFTAKTRAAVWQAFVANVCEGWALKPAEASSKWPLANNFAHAILRESSKPVDFRTQEMLKMAFLTGVKFATGDRMAIHKPFRFRQIDARSTKMVRYMKLACDSLVLICSQGLPSPTKILTDQYDEVTVHLSNYEDDQNQTIARGKRGFLLTAATSEVADEGDGGVAR